MKLGTFKDVTKKVKEDPFKGASILVIQKKPTTGKGESHWKMKLNGNAYQALGLIKNEAYLINILFSKDESTGEIKAVIVIGDKSAIFDANLAQLKKNATISSKGIYHELAECFGLQERLLNEAIYLEICKSTELEQHFMNANMSGILACGYLQEYTTKDTEKKEVTNEVEEVPVEEVETEATKEVELPVPAS